MANNTTPDQQLVNTLPSQLCENKLIECGITIPIYKHKFAVKFDNVEKSREVDLSNSVAFQAGLSLIELLLQREEMVYWLKDHFYPAHHEIFYEEKVLNDDEKRELKSYILDKGNWPIINLTENTILQKIVNARGGKDGVYGLFEKPGEICINLQLITEALEEQKSVAFLQQCYAFMFAMKYIHGFGHYAYFVAGRNYLHRKYGISLDESISTPIGLLRGESGNHLEYRILGLLLSHYGSASISMNIKGITGMHKDDSHMRLLSDSFITKMFTLKTYDRNDDKPNPNWLHYTREEYKLLQRYQGGKQAGGTRLFSPCDDDRTAIKELVFDDNVDDEEIRLFVPASDKNIF